MKKKSCVRILCVVFALVFVLTACKGPSGGSGSKQDDRGTTERTAQSVAEAFHNFYVGLEEPYINSGSKDGRDMIRGILEALTKRDPGLTFYDRSLMPLPMGFCIQTLTPLDAWGNPFDIWFMYSTEQDDVYYITVVSAGPDEEVVCQGCSTKDKMENSDVGDDVVSFNSYVMES